MPVSIRGNDNSADASSLEFYLDEEKRPSISRNRGPLKMLRNSTRELEGGPSRYLLCHLRAGGPPHAGL